MSHLDEGLLHAMLDGELELGEVRQVQAHLGSCASCDTRLKEVRELMAESDRLVATLEPPERTEFAPPLTPTDPPLRASTDLPPLLLLPDEEDAGRRRRRVAMFGIAAAVLVTVGGGLLVQRYNQPDVDELFRASANVPASADSAAVVSSLEAGQPASEPPFSASAPPPAPARASSPETRTAPPVESAPSPRRAAPARPRAGSESGGDVVARRALAAKATAELEQELRLSRARAATAALDSARRAREDDDRR
ncbi:MAG: zf-HC2 domain-containing protein, partial [Gemmatimonadales bacterium]|nr:zf-HC2 domain-containing protein [Gemmatimonadales bacterium]